MAGVTYIIIIAVETYNESADFPKVDYATKDAEDLIEAFKLLGHDEEEFVIMFNEKATRAAILQKVKKITDKALENDRIIFYFAGHGFYENGENLLGSVDAMKTAKIDTCVPINTILGYLKNSLSKQKILFLDCCHSGFEAGEYVRDGADDFEADELLYLFSKEEYCIGFSSCKTNQKSISHPKLRNGVWTHFLIKALKGEAVGAYEKGLLFSDKLQAYLKKHTSEYVKMNTLAKKDQTPIKFGSETDRFIIADLNPIFEEREKHRKLAGLAFTNITMYSEEMDMVKSLPGFKKGFHKVPNSVTPKSNGFIQDIGDKIIQDETSSISEEIKRKLRYKRTEIRVTTDNGGGSIETPDFDYNILISQSETDAGRYLMTRKLENFRNSEIVKNPIFNSIFAQYFDCLIFHSSTKIDIESLIDKIESLEEGSPISVHYNPSDLSYCTISIVGLKYDIEVKDRTVSITTGYMTSPEKLIAAFSETRKAMLLHPEIRMLE